MHVEGGGRRAIIALDALCLLFDTLTRCGAYEVMKTGREEVNMQSHRIQLIEAPVVLCLLAVVGVLALCHGADAGMIPAEPSSAWLFDDDTAEDTYGSVDGTATGDPAFGTDTPLTYPGNKSAEFDGNDYFGFGPDDYNFAADEAFSIAFWVKASDSENSVVVGKMDHNPDNDNSGPDDFRGWYVRAVSGNVSVLLREDWDGTGPSSNLIKKDTSNPVVSGSDWTHILVSYDGSETPGRNRYLR
jgi:hypothetical protein